MWDFSFAFDSSDRRPKYLQIASAILKKIELGELPQETKLPPIRKLSELYDVNNDTIVRAYKYLEQKKVVYSQIGSGTFVSPIVIDERASHIVYENVPILPNDKKFDMKNAINFAGTSTKEDLFPVDDFKNIFNQVLERDKGSAFTYEDGQGYTPLRESVADYLNEYGIHVETDKIQIISGAQQGIELVSRALITYSDYVFVEKPTFYGAVSAYLSRGAKIIEIPMEHDGMDLVALENYLKLYNPKFIYLMPYFQTPTGVSYSLSKKRRILSLCEKYDTYVLEEDNVSDLAYGDEKMIPMKALDYKGRVIYIKTFSKIIMPGLRVSFMVMPKRLVTRFLEVKSGDTAATGFTQRAFDIYLKSGLWNNHRKLMVTFYKHKYEKILQCVQRYLSDYVTFRPPNGGLSLFVKFDTRINVSELCNLLIKRNIIVSPGDLYYAGSESENYVRISFANVSDELIEKGILGIRETIDEMLRQA